MGREPLRKYKTTKTSSRLVQIVTGNEIPADYIDKLGDEVKLLQEFSRSQYPEQFSEQMRRVESEESPSTNPLQSIDLDELNQKIDGKNPLSLEDIPILHERWFKSHNDILTGVPERLPPF